MRLYLWLDPLRWISDHVLLFALFSVIHLLLSSRGATYALDRLLLLAAFLGVVHLLINIRAASNGIDLLLWGVTNLPTLSSVIFDKQLWQLISILNIAITCYKTILITVHEASICILVAVLGTLKEVLTGCSSVRLERLAGILLLRCIVSLLLAQAIVVWRPLRPITMDVLSA